MSTPQSRRARDTVRAAATTTATFDDAKAEAFADRMLGAMNDAALVLMTSIGHRTGLFAHLAEASPVTAAALARRSGMPHDILDAYFVARV